MFHIEAYPCAHSYTTCLLLPIGIAWCLVIIAFHSNIIFQLANIIPHQHLITFIIYTPNIIKSDFQYA